MYLIGQYGIYIIKRYYDELCDTLLDGEPINTFSCSI